ncbi:MAG TPA: glycosyltransferase family 39 protein [Bryobacteraceae bacterium]|nr:glycosyltransferase family 39 protein [Bryobacteraceae bacterium]
MTALLGTVLALCIVRLWLMPLGSSFWVDEMVTALVVRHGPDHPSLSVAPQVPASIYYALPWLSERLLGFSEIAYRIPSVLALGVALWLIASIAARLIHPQAGWLAVFACLALRGFNYQAADARPYALGTCVAAASLYFLIRWLDTAEWRDAALFALTAALVWRVHLIYWPFYAIYPVYAATRLWQRDTRVSWRAIAGVMALAGVSLVPVTITARALLREAGAHVIVPPPAIKELIYALKLGLMATLCVPLAILSRARKWPRGAPWPAWGALSLILGWWLIQPLAIYAFSWTTGNSLFVSRYLSVALPGAALAAVAAASLLVPSRFWRPGAAVLGVGVLLLLGRWGEVWPPHHNSDWRSAARAVNELQAEEELPVICPSPVVEAQPPAWYPDYPLPSFMYPHLGVYEVKGRLYRFPFKESPEAQAYARQTLEQDLIKAGRFVIYGGAGQASYWRRWFSAQGELAGWQHRRLGQFGDVYAVMFESTRLSHSP